MENAKRTFARSKPIWYAIIYDTHCRKRDYLDGFDTIASAEIWLLRNLAEGERGEIEAGHTLKATGVAKYYKYGDRLQRENDQPRAVVAA